MVMIKFSTYNIQYGIGQDGRYDPTRTIAELQNQDGICLQEVTTHWSTCNRDVQPGHARKGAQSLCGLCSGMGSR